MAATAPDAFTPEGTAERSADRGAAILAKYRTLAGNFGDDQEALTDLLLDLMHWAEAQDDLDGLNFADTSETAQMHFSAEGGDLDKLGY